MNSKLRPVIKLKSLFVILFPFALIIFTFCYFLGKESSWRQTFQSTFKFLLPLVIVLAVPILVATFRKRN